MNTHSNEQDRAGSELLSRYRLSTPSPELKERILRVAHEEWAKSIQPSSAVSWNVPLVRLAASIALTLISVHLANRVERRSREPWKPTPQATALTRLDTETWILVDVSPFTAIAAALAEKQQPKRLREHIQQISELAGRSEGFAEKLKQTTGE